MLKQARKELGGITPTGYARGAPHHEYCCVDTPSGTMCVLFSPGEDDGDTKPHPILLREEAEAQACVRFPAAIPSTRNANHVAKYTRELEDEGKDRDPELSAEILPVLWGVWIWLRLLRRYRKCDRKSSCYTIYNPRTHSHQ